MIHVETSPIEYLFWIVVILGLLICVACMVLLCWLSASRPRRKGIPVTVRKKTSSHKAFPKQVTVIPASCFDTAAFIRIYLDNHPSLKAELKEELLNG